MRSVYAKILGWAVVMLLVSATVFFFVSNQIERQLHTGDMYHRIQALELGEARAAWEKGGPAGEAELLARLDHTVGWRHYMLDGHGRDLVTGADRSALAARFKDRKVVFTSDGVMSGTTTADGQYMLIVSAVIPFEPWMFLPYYGLLLLTIAALCWPLALHIGTPLRALAKTVDKFGQGDLSIRAQSSRRDEIGNLARSFDRMADRIETLLTAERRLLQDVSHELRSPLARLSFATELVRGEPDREKAVARIRKDVSRLSTLVGTLLQMTRAEGDPASGQRAEFSLDDLTKELVEDCWVEASARDCELALTNHESVVMTGDRELIRRAIENVLRNAIRYSPPGSLVTLRLLNDAGMARIEIKDAGPGVPEAELSRIFDPFFRVDDTRTAATGGVGLGLSIAMRAVKLHNGWIEAKNAHPGLLVTIGIPLTVKSPLLAVVPE